MTMIGGDFEGFVVLNSNYIPAERVLGGGKNSPITIGPGYVAHPDNVMAEFALQSPVNVADFAKSVQRGREMLDAHLGTATVSFEGSHKFTKEWLKAAALAGEVGCEPDYDSAGNMYQYRPKDLGLYRYAGFHLHFDVSNHMPQDYATRIVDCTIGIASIANGWDMQGNRRNFYGTPGRHRPKPYGIEYRTLSAEMMNHLDGLQELLPAVCAALATGQGPLARLPQQDYALVSKAISTEDTAIAQALYMEVVKHV